MDMMDIAGISMNMASRNIETAASMAILKKTMDTQEIEAQALMNMMPPSDSIIDVRA